MKIYEKIIKHYETCLDTYGDSHLGVDWPNPKDAITRYEVMLDIISINKVLNKSISLLDFGCGTSHLFDYIINKKLNQIKYSGLDISDKFINFSKNKYPETPFYLGDILDSNFEFPKHDYIVMNGVFTEKRSLTFDQMWNYFTEVLEKVFLKSNKGIAFNVMSKNVDWERDDLFHVSIDRLSKFMCDNLSRNFIIRNDYGLYEYTVYLFKDINNKF
ncbi:MAG: class I SAM-dependent methyltransferase [Flavobacteriaceae bacterium]|nr:class I SAM-dependent methyltransferase [Flavobacteriaceae bacterium]